MPELIFLLGRPGSGKSRTARCIKEVAAELGGRVPGLPSEGWSVLHMTDYDFLYRMFREDMKKEEAHRRFRPTSFGGFDVLDLRVLPLALRQVSAYIAEHLHEERTLILVEFARRDYSYQEVWRHFRSDMLDQASFLYLEADIETCIRRIEQRALNQVCLDDQYVSREIMLDYYGSLSGEPANLRSYFGKERVVAIENNGSWPETWMGIRQFLSRIPARVLAPQRQTVKLMLAH
jgi:hypothetical protein